MIRTQEQIHQSHSPAVEPENCKEVKVERRNSSSTWFLIPTSWAASGNRSEGTSIQKLHLLKHLSKTFRQKLASIQYDWKMWAVSPGSKVCAPALLLLPALRAKHCALPGKGEWTNFGFVRGWAAVQDAGAQFRTLANLNGRGSGWKSWWLSWQP